MNTECTSVEEEKKIVHLCIWTLQKSDLMSTKNNGFIYKNCIKSPQYFATEFTNLKWFFELKKSLKREVYELLLFCGSTIKSTLEPNFTFEITTKFQKHLPNTLKCGPLIMNGMRKNKIISFSLRKIDPKHRPCCSELMKEMIIVCRITQAEKSVQFPRSYESFFLKEKLSDITVLVKRKQFHAHKVILVANSTVFLGMFSHQMVENISSKLEIHDFEPNVVKEFLRYLYTGKVSNWDNYTDGLFAIAHKYQVEDLKKKCMLLLCKNLTIGNVIHVLLLSDLYDLKHLKKKCLYIINKNYEEVRNKGVLKNLENQPRLFMDILKARNEQVLRETVIESSITKLPRKTSFLWTVESYWDYYKSPRFQMETGEPGKYFFWWFRMVKNHLLLYVAKDVPAVKSFLHLEMVLQRPLTLEKKFTYTIDLDNNSTRYGLSQFPKIFTNLILFRRVELLPKQENKQIVDDDQSSEEKWSYEFFLRNTNCSDVILHTQGRQFPAHKIILANRSEKFKEMFLPNKSLFRFTKENETQELKIQIDIQMHDLQSEVCEKFLKYIYNGEVENLDSLATDLYVAAREYEVRDLKLVCENILLTNVNARNVISTLIFSEKYNIESLKDECIVFIAKFFQEIEENEFCSLERTYPNLLMKILEVTHTGRRLSIENTYYANLAGRDVLSCLMKEAMKEVFSLACNEVWYLCFPSFNK